MNLEMKSVGVRRKYRIPLDHEILEDHGVFFQRALSDEHLFVLRIAPAKNVVIGFEPQNLVYELNNIQLEYEIIHSQELAYKALSNYRDNVLQRQSKTILSN